MNYKLIINNINCKLRSYDLRSCKLFMKGQVRKKDVLRSDVSCKKVCISHSTGKKIVLLTSRELFKIPTLEFDSCWRTMTTIT